LERKKKNLLQELIFAGESLHGRARAEESSGRVKEGWLRREPMTEWHMRRNRVPGGETLMRTTFTLEYWQDEGWYVGQLREVPGVFSQGEILTELEENIRDAFELVLEDTGKPVLRNVQQKEIEVEI
jgi:predicted RNase H-like HicB family nuclease